MGELINLREAVERIRGTHKPGKLVGLYRGLRRQHGASQAAGWTSAALLVSGILNQMIHHGKTTWWDLVDLNFSSMASPDSNRDEIGIRTLARKVEFGEDGDDFITAVSLSTSPGRPQAPVEGMTCTQVNERMEEILKSFGLLGGGFYPMIAKLGDAAREANLHVYSVHANDKGARLRLFSMEENRGDGKEVTLYDIHVNLVALLKDIEVIRNSLNSLQR